MRTMYDSVQPTAIPRNADMVAGYINGTWKWSAADWVLFPDAVKIRIATQPEVLDGDVLDCELGDATPIECVVWVIHRRAMGADPTVYCSWADWPIVQAAFTKAHCKQPHYWIARYNGVRELPSLNGITAIAKQYANPPAHKQGHFDLTCVSDEWMNDMITDADITRIRDGILHSDLGKDGNFDWPGDGSLAHAIVYIWQVSNRNLNVASAIENLNGNAPLTPDQVTALAGHLADSLGPDLTKQLLDGLAHRLNS